jgi:hypothetical protein
MCKKLYLRNTLCTHNYIVHKHTYVHTYIYTRVLQALVTAILNREEVEDVAQQEGKAKLPSAEHPRLQEFRAGATWWKPVQECL